MNDPYSANTVLLLHMEGDNNSTTFTDSSGIPKTITRYGDTQISTAQSKWGQGAGYFDGSGDYLTPIIGSTNTIFGDLSTPWTLEFYLMVTGRYAVNQYPVVFSCEASAQTRYTFFCAGKGLTADIYAAFFFNNNQEYLNLGSYSVSTWHHVAYCCEGSRLIKGYVNGVFKSSITPSQYFGKSTAVSYRIGNGVNFIDSFQGYLQDLRITNGVARYTEDFTPPAARLPDPDPVTGLILPSGYRHDLYDGGAYRITGNVDELGVLGSYRVRLFDRQSGRCVRETWSAADGSYAFNYIDYRLNGYFAIAFDHGDNPLNAAIADLITPEPMP